MKLKTYKYRLYPNKTQEVLLDKTLEVCRQIYNKCLEERKTSYEKTGVGVKATAQMKNLERFEIFNLKSVHSQVIQDAVWRVDSAFDAFFRRVRKGEKEVGYPRFKSYQRYDSFCFPQGGFKLLDDKKHLKISKIGSVKIKFHRDLNSGIIKNLLIKKDSLGRFYAYFILEEKEYVLKEKTQIQSKIGLDLGCIDFVTTSDGNKTPHPKYYKKSEKELKKIQSKYSSMKMLPKENKKKIKTKRKLLKIHTKIKNQRNDFLHKLSSEFVNKFDLICVEDLNIKKMVSGDNNYRNLNKSILDGGWRQFLDFLSYKAEEAGKTVIKVNPAYTSQVCSACGKFVKKN